MAVRALLVLSDGLVFEGRSFGAGGEATGEVVFNTSMTGYQEILTDPSYRGQIVTMTYTQMGNYGVNPEDIESSGGPKVEGFVVKEYLDFPSNWRSSASLSQYLKDFGIVAIEGLDTRALTRHLRDHGAQMGIISTVEGDPANLLERVRAHPGIGGVDLVREVTSPEAYEWREGLWEKPAPGGERPGRVVVYDFGVKFNILRNLVDAGFAVKVVPAATPAEAVLAMDPDGILFSNGPGDPEAVTSGIEAAKKLIGKKPLFGICLGHQVLGLALGGRTYKLKFGHHGGNHPVMDLETGKVEITSQNHNYCVETESLRGAVTLTHRNLYDGTEEGMKHVELPLMSVQHHPEAGPGPNDASHIFSRFRRMMEGEVFAR
jgi:carbamoyl-phosphate synthase small subunit